MIKFGHIVWSNGQKYTSSCFYLFDHPVSVLWPCFLLKLFIFKTHPFCFCFRQICSDEGTPIVIQHPNSKSTQVLVYSGAWIPNAFWFRMVDGVRFLNGVLFSNGFEQNGRHFVWISNGPDHSKSEPWLA